MQYKDEDDVIFGLVLESPYFCDVQWNIAGGTSADLQSKEGERKQLWQFLSQMPTRWHTHSVKGAPAQRQKALMFDCASWLLGQCRQIHTAGPAAHCSAHTSLLSHSCRIHQAAHKCHTKSQRGCKASDLPPGRKSICRPFREDWVHFHSSSRQAGHGPKTGSKANELCEVTKVLTKPTVVIISQYIHVSKHQVLHLKLIKCYVSIISQ